MGSPFAGYWYGLAALCVSALAFFLLLAWEAVATRLRCLVTGTRRVGGFRRRSASTTGRERGTRTQGTATTAGCSSYSLRGLRLEDESDLISLLRESSSTALGSSTAGTVARGASGEPLKPVV